MVDAMILGTSAERRVGSSHLAPQSSGKETAIQIWCKRRAWPCADKYNNSRRKLSLETRTKISHSLQKKSVGFNGEFKPLKNRVNSNRTCKNCGKQLCGQQNSFCNNKCQQDYRYKEYINKWKEGDETGLSGEYSISRHIKRFLIEKTNCK